MTLSNSNLDLKHPATNAAALNNNDQQIIIKLKEYLEGNKRTELLNYLQSLPGPLSKDVLHMYAPHDQEGRLLNYFIYLGSTYVQQLIRLTTQEDFDELFACNDRFYLCSAAFDAAKHTPAESENILLLLLNRVSTSVLNQVIKIFKPHYLFNNFLSWLIYYEYSHQIVTALLSKVTFETLNQIFNHHPVLADEKNIQPPAGNTKQTIRNSSCELLMICSAHSEGKSSSSFPTDLKYAKSLTGISIVETLDSKLWTAVAPTAAFHHEFSQLLTNVAIPNPGLVNALLSKLTDEVGFKISIDDPLERAKFSLRANTKNLRYLIALYPRLRAEFKEHRQDIEAWFSSYRIFGIGFLMSWYYKRQCFSSAEARLVEAEQMNTVAPKIIAENLLLAGFPDENSGLIGLILDYYQRNFKPVAASVAKLGLLSSKNLDSKETVSQVSPAPALKKTV